FQSVSNQLVGLVGGSHGRSEFTVLHSWVAVDFRLGRRAANPAALLVFISSVFLSDVVFVCCRSSYASSFFSSHGLVCSYKEDDLWKKKWSCCLRKSLGLIFCVADLFIFSVCTYLDCFPINCFICDQFNSTLIYI
ncbi:unnamed protein product, partial [Prunus brigantina]